MNPILRKVLGESHSGIFPKDAEEVERTASSGGKPLRAIVNVMQEPSRPPGEKEKYLTPYSALTAPDCTPDALKPIDSSRVPGAGAGSERFTAADLDQTGPEAPQTGLGQEHPSLKAMDVLLNRQRTTGVPPKDAAAFAQAGAIRTEDQAASFVASLSEADVASAKVGAQAALLPAQNGGAMPEPAAPGDGRAMLNAFRKFVG